MSDLVDFLLARIADDEAAIEPGPDPDGGHCGCRDGVHIRAARAVAECASKRRLIDELTNSDFPSFRMMPPVAAELLKIMACVYAAHPDYRDEWRP